MSSKRGMDFVKAVFDPLVHDPASVDNAPIEVPLEWREPPSLQEEIRRYIRVEMSRAAAENGHETFEEANDLEFSDDDDFSSASELTEDQEMAMMAVARSSRDNGGGNGTEFGSFGKGSSEGGFDVGDKVARAADGKDGKVESESGVQGGSGVSKESSGKV